MPSLDTAERAQTRILAIYNLAGRLKVQPDAVHPVNDWLDMGRFAHHIEASASLLPLVTSPVRIEPGQFHLPAAIPGSCVQRITAALATTPRRDGLLLLDIELGKNPGPGQVAEFLYATWRRRADMRVGPVALLDWLAARLDQVTTESGQRLTYGQNVHQCVFAGGKLARRLVRQNKNGAKASPGVITLVFRGAMPANRGSNLDIRRPPSLNSPGRTVVAHGRGVSLIVGWTIPVENAFAVAAAGLVNAAGVVRRVRLQSLAALKKNEDAALSSSAEVSALIVELSARLNELQLDLSFGIEIYADSSLMPELLVESYHSSLRSVAALPEALTNTSRIVGRVAAVIESRHALLNAATHEYTEQRGRIFAGAVAIGTLLALPPALLLAYFGTNSTQVSNGVSIFNMHHYLIVYLVIWIPFILLVGGAAIMRSQVRPRWPTWHYSAAGAAEGTAGKLADAARASSASSSPGLQYGHDGRSAAAGPR
jgi:hypothetical protein